MNPLFESLKAWDRYDDFIRKAKDSAFAIDKAFYCRAAALYRMRFECYQALYWQGIRP